MNEEDKFEARHQEIHDENTGVTVTFGTHASADALPAGQSPGQAGGRQGLRWMRIAVPYGNPDNPTEAGETKTSTITFGPDGQALKILPHVQSTDAGDVTDAPDPKAD